MTSPKSDDPSTEFKTFSARLDARIHEFEKLNELPERDRALARQIAEHRRRLQEKVDAAIRQGKMWPIIKAELARDFSSLYDDFERFEAQLDSDTNKHSPRK